MTTNEEDLAKRAKFSWNVFVTMDADKAIEIIKTQEPTRKIMKIHNMESPPIIDIDHSRIRVYYDNYNKVVCTPFIG